MCASRSLSQRLGVGRARAGALEGGLIPTTGTRQMSLSQLPSLSTHGKAHGPHAKTLAGCCWASLLSVWVGGE